MIHASAPGRCSLVGNPTDGYGGTVISSSISERAVVEISPADEIVLDICGERERIRDRADLDLTHGYTDVAKAVLRLFEDSVLARKFHVKARTSIPLQAGLAGSTAMLAAILGGVLRMLEVNLAPYQVAETIRFVEFELLRCVCGFQDQYLVTFGGLKYLDFREKEPTARGESVFATVEDLEPYVGQLPLILANTGVQRHSGSVHQGLRERWIAGDREVVRGYERCARLAREAKKALLAGDWTCVGLAMNENHAIQRALGGSGEANERLIAAALDAGALGAKLAGAGKGGTIIALHEEPEYLARKLESAGAALVLKVVPSEGLVVDGQF